MEKISERATENIRKCPKIVRNQNPPKVPTRLDPVEVTIDGLPAASRYKTHRKGAGLQTEKATGKVLLAAVTFFSTLKLPVAIEIDTRENFEDGNFEPEDVNIHVYTPEHHNVDVWFRGRLMAW